MKSLTVEKGNYVTTVTLNRVEKRNAMSLSMWQALGDLYQELETDDDTRVICGHGPETIVGDERQRNPFLN